MSTLRILHTSDWHIGQRLHGKEREKEHQRFFDWLLNTLKEQKVDVLIVAGDIFDVGYPSNSALKQYYRFLYQTRQTGCRNIIITGGNHDYISTLNAPKAILEALDITVMGGVPENLSDEIVTVKDEQGNPQAFVCAVPFLRDREIRQAVAGESYDDRLKATREGILQHFKDIARLVEEQNPEKLPVIATGHLYMAGASVSESEREIQIGNQAAFSLDGFPETFDYLALGHIHRPQRIGGLEHIRYSGSPLPLSFSERKDEKQVVLIEFRDRKLECIKPLLVPACRKLVSINGTLSEVREKLENYRSAGDLKDWAEVKVTEEQYDPELTRLYKEMQEEEFEVEIVKPSITYKDRINGLSALYEEQPSLRDLGTGEVFEKLLEKSGFNGKEELVQTYNLLIEEMNQKE
ncbi:MAG: exonuclease SbcCD subunit D C-terminal domain-containing protein [Marinifilaceae bacterium]